MKILVIDNYDSFVYNLVCMMHNLVDATIDVVKNDKVNLETVHLYDKILLSPGPGIPMNAGKMLKVLEQNQSVSILGVCLGHQAIGEFSGGILHNLPEPLHGIASTISIEKEDYLFEDLPRNFKVGHYHSWVVEPSSTADFEVLAKDANQNIMAIKHKQFDWRGVQFHPESVLTEHGAQILNNWLKN
ncbi:aminodeoxychorismate/anthranilate synthase component II [Flavobacterium sp.]|uniref:anthranilate synthase component II n=1 Tax=Flavobacterium sp. TaxID=239 RepID=UPI00262222DB|nr:aminodeoxychorismate/anthranilate synthase component II [Flavobacterium sp.]